jgi:hypothetical protein
MVLAARLPSRRSPRDKPVPIGGHDLVAPRSTSHTTALVGSPSSGAHALSCAATSPVPLIDSYPVGTFHTEVDTHQRRRRMSQSGALTNQILGDYWVGDLIASGPMTEKGFSPPQATGLQPR